VVVALNKSTGAVNAEIAIDHPRSLSTGRTFQITAATPALVPGAMAAAAGRNHFRLKLPPSSVTTLVLTP
jgi:O-glycosyl hydrolase